MPIFISDLAICVSGQEGRMVNLVVMEQPQSLLAEPWPKGGKFEPGRWYRRVLGSSSSAGAKSWKLIEDGLLPTVLLRSGQQQSLIEMSLPVVFAPDLAGLAKFGAFKFKVPILANRPICPLFGPESSEVLPLPRLPFRTQSGKRPTPGSLYCLRVHLSFSPGSLPAWTYGREDEGALEKFRWSAAFQDQNSLYRHLFSSYHSEGIVLWEGTGHGPPNGGGGLLHLCLLLDIDGRVALHVDRKDASMGVGQRRQFLPLMLNCYEKPLILALDYPSSGEMTGRREAENVAVSWVEDGEDRDKYQIRLDVTERILAQLGAKGAQAQQLLLPFLGLLIDPFGHIAMAGLKLGQRICIAGRVQWHLDRQRAVWTAMGCKKVVEKQPKAEVGKMTVRREGREAANSSAPRSALPRTQLPSPSSARLPSTDAKMLAVSFATKRLTTCIFLTFDRTRGFTGRRDLSLHPGSQSPPVLGNWYLADIFQPAGDTQGILRSLAPAPPGCETRVAKGICAQFKCAGQQPVIRWHSSHRFCDSVQFHPEREWWPRLCARCFPGEGQAASASPMASSSSATPSTHIAMASGRASFGPVSFPVKPIQKKTTRPSSELLHTSNNGPVALAPAATPTSSQQTAVQQRKQKLEEMKRKLLENVQQIAKDQGGKQRHSLDGQKGGTKAASCGAAQRPVQDRPPPIPVSSMFRRAKVANALKQRGEGKGTSQYGQFPAIPSFESGEEEEAETQLRSDLRKAFGQLAAAGNCPEEAEEARAARDTGGTHSATSSATLGFSASQNSSPAEGNDLQMGDKENANPSFPLPEMLPGGFGFARRRRSAQIGEKKENGNPTGNGQKQPSPPRKERTGGGEEEIITEFRALSMNDESGGARTGVLRRRGNSSSVAASNAVDEALNAAFDDSEGFE